MSKITLIAALFLLLISCKKNDTIDPPQPGSVLTTPTPLIDFGTATYRGTTGGLYTTGNQRPPAHDAAGISIAQNIRPLNTAGNQDNVNGKVVWVSIGMSNTTQQVQTFLQLMDTFANKHQKLLLVDGAQGGQDIVAINNSSAPYWDTVRNRLLAKGASMAQVQIIWFKQAEANPSDTAFATYPDALKEKYKTAMHILKMKFPNAKIIYHCDRMYAGYSNGNLNPEPYAWYTGWTVKKLIADQINGDATLSYTGSNPQTAYMCWGPYLWAKGTIPRSDGLVWNQNDFQNDGTHPSALGRMKVANMMLNFFMNDATSTPWFLKP